MQAYSFHKEGVELAISPHHDVYQEYYDKIVLTEDEEGQVIREYSRKERAIKVKSGCAIGAGYTTCMDIGFRAVDMFEAIRPDINRMLKLQGGVLVPQVHEKIAELRQFTETFLYYFSQGANAERVSVRLSFINIARTHKRFLICL